MGICSSTDHFGWPSQFQKAEEQRMYSTLNVSTPKRSLDNGKLPYCGRQQIVDNKLWRSTRTPTALYLGMHVWRSSWLHQRKHYSARLCERTGHWTLPQFVTWATDNPNPFLNYANYTLQRLATTKGYIPFERLVELPTPPGQSTCSRCLQHISASSRTMQGLCAISFYTDVAVYRRWMELECKQAQPLSCPEFPSLWFYAMAACLHWVVVVQMPPHHLVPG